MLPLRPFVKESQSGGELLAATGGAIFRAASNAAVVLAPYCWAKVGFFIGVCLRCGFLISCFAFCSHTCYSSAYSQCSHDSFAMRRKSWEPHMDGRFQLGMSLREVRPGTSLTAGPHPGAVDVSGLFHQTVTNCRGRESVCGLWPLPFHFFSSCAGIASLAPSDATQPTHLHPRSFREVERGPPRRRDIQHRHFTVAIISCEMLTMMCDRRVMRMAQFIIAILV